MFAPDIPACLLQNSYMICKCKFVCVGAPIFLGHNSIIGGIRIGQLRVKKETCSASNVFAPMKEGFPTKFRCYGDGGGSLWTAEGEEK